MNLIYATAQILARADYEVSESVQAAVEALLAELGTSLSCEVGLLWRVVGNVLRVTTAWHPADQEESHLEQISRSALIRRGQDLPGRVWSAAEDLWVEDLTTEAGGQGLDLHRLGTARAAQFKGAVGIPLIMGQEVLGVLEFFSHAAFDCQSHRPADQTLGGIAAQLAIFLSGWEAVIASRDKSFKIQQLSQELHEQKKSEKELQQSSIALSAANEELEAFSYSVSHDLRAPLRGIDGFTRALIEDCGDQLGLKGRHYLDRVRAATQTMARLIEDLLNLARVSQTEVRWREVDLSVEAQKITTELKRTDPRRHVEFMIHPGLKAHGDPGLLHAMLENLFNNAWKYTSKRSEGRIEFGRGTDQDSTVFYLKDNGAGFDLTHAGRLFGPFQRLHSNEEFPGIGIGLATVRRIVRRHGGNIWAHAEPGKGAVFYFSLEEQKNGEGRGRKAA